jgi:3-mercaptopyruvate sulfurtransferase SseA
VHLEWFNLLDSETNEFKPEAEIKRILTEHSITPDKNVYTY